MAHQLLATFYVESPDYLYEPHGATVTAEIYEGTTLRSVDFDAANTNTAHFRTRVEPETYDEGGQTRHRHKIEVYRAGTYTGSGAGIESPGNYRLYMPGTYERKLVVTIDGDNNSIPGQRLERTIYLTIQPELEVYRTIAGQRVDLVKTESTGDENSNPLDVRKEIIVETTSESAREIISSTSVSGAMSVRSNFPLNAFCEDFAVASTSSLSVKDKINLTRSAAFANAHTLTANNATPSERHAGIVIASDLTNTNNFRTYTLTFEQRRFLDMPLYLQSALELRPSTDYHRYTGVEHETEPFTRPILPLSVVLQTPHIFNVTPLIITLDDDNNYQSFVTVETNDDAEWTLTPPPGLDVSAPSGVGRAAVVVTKAADFDWDGENFHRLELTAESDVDPLAFPDILGEYYLSSNSHVHVERYEPIRNALIPKQTDNSAVPVGWESFNNTLTDYGTVPLGTGGTFNPSNLENLNTQFPTIEYEFADGAHRIRSWSLQSAGTSSVARATRLLLTGKTPEGKWIILDDSGTLWTSLWIPGLYSANKPRRDRVIKNKELVTAIRISAVGQNGTGSSVQFPQIQVFAGEPVVPNMTANGTDDVTIYPLNDSSRLASLLRIFDRAVAGTVGLIGAANAYLNVRPPENRIAFNGNLHPFEVVGGVDDTQLGWLAILFPAQKLIGYLYSIEKLLDDANQPMPCAAALYFEGLKTQNSAIVSSSSDTGGWEKIDLISLDKCFGNSAGITANLSTEQTTLDDWVENVLGLTGSDKDKAFIIDDDGNNRNVIQYDDTQNQWVNNGSAFPDTIDDVANQTHYADFTDIEKWEQLRFSARSIMNIPPSGITTSVAMPEIQFFGLPEPSATANRPTVAYLFAETAQGTPHNILGKHQRLPHQRYENSRTYFRFYIGGVQNAAASPRLYLSLQNTNGTMTTQTTGTSADSANSNNRAIVNDAIDLSESGDYRTSPSYFELYIKDESGNDVILSSGYTGGGT